MSKLTIKLRMLATNGCDSNYGNIQVNKLDLLELINSIEDYEIKGDVTDELNTRLSNALILSGDKDNKLSKIIGLPRYICSRVHGVEETPVGDYVRVEHIDEVINGE